jgi:amino-acid N-acetyltransferase
MAGRNNLGTVRALLSANGLPDADIDRHIEHFLLAWDDQRLIATVGVELLGSLGLLRSLCVASDWRRRGLATTMCERVQAYARHARVDRLYLLTTTAQVFFERNGFSVCPRESVPPQVRRTAEFRSLCPASAVCMARDLV